MEKMELQKLREYCKDKFGDNINFDFEHEIDRTLTFSENKRLIEEKIKELYPSEQTQKDLKEMEKNNTELEKQNIEKLKEENSEVKNEDLIYKEQCNFVVVGKKGASKTTLAWAIAEKVNRLSKRNIYVYNFPKPELLEKLPFKVINVKRLDALFNITDGVVIIDESHEIFNILDKRVNQDLKILLSHSRQNNTDFIFICHNSYFVNRSLFSFVDIKIIKEVNEKHWELERPYMKKLYEDIHVFGKPNFYIDSDYVKGYKNFNKPSWWNEDISNAYRSQVKNEDFFK